MRLHAFAMSSISTPRAIGHDGVQDSMSTPCIILWPLWYMSFSKLLWSWFWNRTSSLELIHESDSSTVDSLPNVFPLVKHIGNCFVVQESSWKTSGVSQTRPRCGTPGAGMQATVTKGSWFEVASLSDPMPFSFKMFQIF